MRARALHFLSPCCVRCQIPISTGAQATYSRFYSANIALREERSDHLPEKSADLRLNGKRLKDAGAGYPRLDRRPDRIEHKTFRARYGNIKPGEELKDVIVTIYGRLSSIRVAGSKLAFLDILRDGERLQVVCEYSRLAEPLSSPADFEDFCRSANRGDIFSIIGYPYRTPRGDLSVGATNLPKLLSPTMHPLPTELLNPSVRVQKRHVDLLANKESAEALRLRSYIIQHVRWLLIQNNFLEVETPILADGAGGAIARPFLTAASEFSERTLSLRISPELWLKRLVLGGMDKIFEIGPCFRNEGIDTTHNPQFSTCEFYQAYATLEDLISKTENMLSSVADEVAKLRQTSFTTIPQLDISFRRPYRRLDFIPALEEAIGRPLPNLSTPDATTEILHIFEHTGLAVPSIVSLPHLLDKLSSHYLEPQCREPTFILHHPECMSPLAKSFVDAKTGQSVSARFELFVQGRELANAYEEENSPIEQRRKFMDQLAYRSEDNPAVLDEGYLEALEWGLPPTGGWGCGLDRLVMIFTGSTRIGQVLSFGTLRNVVGLASGEPS